jgi:hypothetical protein
MPSRDYPDEFVYKALELAATTSTRSAAEALEMPESTLRHWTTQPDYQERWVELRRINAPKWRERMAVPLEDIVDSYAELERKALEKAQTALENLDPKDVGNFLRSISWAKNHTAEAAGKLRGQPSQVVEHRVTAGQLEKGLAELEQLAKAAAAVESTAEELPALPEGGDQEPHED